MYFLSQNNLQLDRKFVLNPWTFDRFYILTGVNMTSCISLSSFDETTSCNVVFYVRNLSVAPVALSTFMSVISGILVLGTTAEMYLYGTQLWMDSVARSFTYAISAYLFVPMMYQLKLTSVFTVN